MEYDVIVFLSDLNDKTNHFQWNRELVKDVDRKRYTLTMSKEDQAKKRHSLETVLSHWMFQIDTAFEYQWEQEEQIYGYIFLYGKSIEQ